MLIVLGSVLSGCATSGNRYPDGGSDVPSNSNQNPFLSETPPPEGDWRPHRFTHCFEDTDVSTAVEKFLGTSSEYFRHGSGSDGMVELEIALEEGVEHSILLLTLGQLYLMAGQGDPSLLPVEGPAADVGDWNRNKSRLLGRAKDLLLKAAADRPDDAAVDYLLADVARAEGKFIEAADIVRTGESKCTWGRSFRIMKQYQSLNNYPPRYLGSPAPEYPERSLQEGVTGDVVLDLLLSPTGEIRQAFVVSTPSEDLTQAAVSSLLSGTYEVARVGKYPIWSWLRVKTAFNLAASE